MHLETAEADVLGVESAAFARALPDPAARIRYEQLAAAAASGEVPDDLMAPLETMLELLFNTGRVANRAVLQSVFGRTRRGRHLASAAREVNRALRTLRGQTVAELRLSAVGPSLQSLVIETDRCRLTLDIDRDGARIASLEAG
ncbi:MAG: hypothetical protein JO352_34005 [Chloroflexi bacterium]|nr:hypothetical protein [Chloroflexota bacterium]